MKILFCGDIVGRSGRKAIAKYLPELQKEHNFDLIIANVDNASGGFGVNKNTCDELMALGVNVLTGGDHIWDQKEINTFIHKYPNLLRPLNFPKNTIGRGAAIFQGNGGQKILVIHLLGQVFIKNNLNCPFEMAQEMVEKYRLKQEVDAIIVDFHADATSEKMAMGQFLDGKASFIVGSHTHIPTNDYHIMAQGSAYQTDAGMCGDYNSVIGMQRDVPIKQFLTKRKAGRMQAATGEGTFCATIVEIDNITGLARQINVVKKGGSLEKMNRDA